MLNVYLDRLLISLMDGVQAMMTALLIMMHVILVITDNTEA